MKKYDSYKDSGIKWIGEIPTHWDIARLKFNSRIKTGYTPPMDNSENYSEDGMIWVKPDNLEFFNEILDSKEKVSVQGVKEQNIITKGSVLLCCIGTIGKFGIAGIDLLTNQQICGVTFIESLIPSFGKYLIYSSEEELNKHANGNVVRILNATSLGNIVYPIPTIEEQTAIANYLDQKTTQIDDLIAKKERLIQLLEEERTAIINQAVTKGLDPTVPMKDSGIDWIGDLPFNWQIKRIKHTTYVKGRIGWQGMRSDEFLESSDSYVVTGTDFEKGLVKWDTCYQVPLERYEEDPFIQLREGDLLITKDGTIGKIAVVKNIPKIATLNSGVFLTRPLSDTYVPEFMYWILYSEVFKTFYDFNKSGSTIQHLYQNVFNEFKYPLPPMKEQTEIINHINIKTNELDLVISKTKQEIELLKEYKTALISEVVTGKVDVRDWVAGEN